MARLRRSSGVGTQDIRIPGIYARLLEREREVVKTPDPRWARTEGGRRGELCAPDWLHKSPYLADLEADRPVELPVWRLGGRSEPDERLRRMRRRDRSIVVWLVHPDDVVMPVRRGDEM